MTKLPVDLSVFRSRAYARFHHVARNRGAIPITSSVHLTFRERVTQTHSGRELLNILSGWRAGDLNAFNL